MSADHIKYPVIEIWQDGPSRGPEGSNLMWLLDWRGAQTRMSLGKKKLPTCERDTIRSCIREGAKNN